MNNRILLINPPYPFEESPAPPFGLISLGAYLEERGFEVLVEDYVVNTYSRHRAERVLKEFTPRIVGATGVTMNIKPSMEILHDYKSADPGIITVAGGPHVTFDAEDMLREYPFLDYIVRGEGERTIHELLSMEDPPAVSEIPGLSYRGDGTIVHNRDRELIEDINELPLPARHLVQLSKYRAVGLPVNMVTSRGCPFPCIFCVGRKMVGKKVRYFDVNRVVDEFEMLAGLGFHQINIVDDLFTVNRKRCIAICDEIARRNINQNWTAFARVDTVSAELLAAMKRAGCTTLCFGVESGNQEILDLVKKRITLDNCREAVRLCNEAGIQPMTSYILGLPGETPETVRETMEFSRNLSPSYGFHILAPFPGTEVRESCGEYGIRILTSDWDLYDANRSVCESIHLRGEKVDRVVNEFNSGIDRYVQGCIDRFERGEKLPPDEEELVRKILSSRFAITLVQEELVEQYPGINGEGDDAVIEDAAAFIAEKTGISPEKVRSELDRLFGLQCLAFVRDGGTARLGWL